MAAGISKKLIRKALDEAEIEFRWCERALANMRKSPKNGGVASNVLTFQVRLRDALEQLEKVYRAIKREEKRLIANKKNYNVEWFPKRMAKLSSYTAVVKEGLSIGRALGDAFAWFFYQNDRPLIEQHLKQQRQPLMPPDIGGIGEKLTLERIPVLDGKMLLYHGITTFLRLGDVSLIDLEKLRVASIGELKTYRSDSKTVTISLNLIAGDQDNLPNPQPKLQNQQVSQERPIPPNHQATEQRLKRQIQQMGEALSETKEKPYDRLMSNYAEFHFQALEDLVNNCNSSTFRYLKVDNGMIIAALRLPSKSTLGSRLLSDYTKLVDRAALQVLEQAKRILLPGAEDNSLSLNIIGNPKNLSLTDAACPPLLTWHIDPDLLAEILFGEVVVLTIVNRAHLHEKIRQRGFKIELNERGQISRAVREMSNGTRQHLERFDYFFRLPERTLMSENSLMKMIDEAIEQISDLSDNLPAKIEFRPQIDSHYLADRTHKPPLNTRAE